VPEDCRWRDVRAVISSVGQALQKANPETLYGTGLAACILVFRQHKKRDRKNKVLILDASREYKPGRAQNELLPAHVSRIHGWYRAHKDVAGVARVVTLDEIAANDHNLNIPRYVEPTVDKETLTLEQPMQRLSDSAKAAFAAEDELVGILEREGLLK
jgi:type I restriction enzyme M protein